MEQTYQDLLSLLSHALFNTPTDVKVTEDVLKEAEEQAVRSLITNDYVGLCHGIRVFDAHARLTEDLKGIPFVTIKGYASAYYYPQPSKRPMGDVDFFVPPEYYSDAVDRLKKSGYTPTDFEHARHETFKKDTITYELHSEIKGIPNGLDGIETENDWARQKIRNQLSDLIESAVTVETQQGQVVIPDAFHHGLIMLLHVAGHMINDGGIGLRHLCDWAVYVHRICLEDYKDKFKSVGLWKFACQLTAVSTRYLGLPEQSWTGDWDEVFLEALIEDIMSAGNFSIKDQTRSVGMSLSAERTVMSSIVRMAKKRYPYSADHPVLLPAALLCMGCSYLKNRLSGGKKWVNVSTLTEGQKRKQLYEQFELFEVS